MDWTMDADLPHRFKQWKRQVRNEIRLLMAGDSSTGEVYACTMVLVCAGEQGEDIIDQAGLSGLKHGDVLKDYQMLKEKDCTAEHIIQLALRAEYRETANTRMSKTVNSSSASTALQDIMSGSTTHLSKPCAVESSKATLFLNKLSEHVSMEDEQLSVWMH
ncbi:hypothetical protein CAPTEDRAFT_197267 [Capitella teleta]|uniref:Uncharacterized protein n=1 Tax=Capitella teleta TaxID=283909 RepID=R7U1R2_CAPTE|nr:hypothetical protein CAPTEDRAFT_197267 [Capitella teleta]|eukprot:ELT99914.1 hypothetical protein CAPTEDRAFT_197267 [Capitella teleta]